MVIIFVRTVGFMLQMFGFSQPTPETDDSPQVIRFSMTTSANDHVAYYTPMVSGRWSIGPVYSTSNSQLLQYSACINNDIVSKDVKLMWSRNGTVVPGTWSLSQVTVLVGSQCVYGMNHSDSAR